MRRDLPVYPGLVLPPGVYWLHFKVGDRVAYQISKHPNWASRFVREAVTRWGRRVEYLGGGLTHVDSSGRTPPYVMKIRIHGAEIEPQAIGGLVTLGGIVALIAALVYLNTLAVERIVQDITDALTGSPPGSPVEDVTESVRSVSRGLEALMIVGAVGLGLYLAERYGVIDS